MIDIYNLPLDDPKVWQLFADGRTTGIFQLETSLGKIWSKRLKPTCIEHLAALVSILRPGCLKALSGDPPKSMTQRFCDRKNGIEEVEYYHPALKPSLEKTYGVMIFQEQMMQIARDIAGFSLEDADVLRKACGKKLPELMAKVKKQFLEGCNKTGIVNNEQGEEIFNWIQESQKYSFNASHGYSYALNAYISAYIKTYYPLEFFCAYLRGAEWKQDSQEEINNIINDAKLHNIKIDGVDLRDKQVIPYIKNNAIKLGISNAKKIGTAAVTKVLNGIKQVEELLNLPIDKWTWLQYLIHFSDLVPTEVNIALISTGFLDWLQQYRNTMLYEFDIYNKLTDKEKEWIKKGNFNNLIDALTQCSVLKKHGGGCFGVKRQQFVQNLVNSLQNPPHLLNDTADWITWIEEKYLGIALNSNRIDSCDLAIHANCTCKDVLNGKNGYLVIAAEIKACREVTTKKGKNPGQKMAFLSISDGTCILDNVVCFPNIWKSYRSLLHQNNTVMIQGEKSNSHNSIIIKKVTQI